MSWGQGCSSLLLSTPFYSGVSLLHSRSLHSCSTQSLTSLDFLHYLYNYYIVCALFLSQTSFGHISINSSTILIVSTATKSPWKDLSINASYVSRQSILAEILGRSTDNYYKKAKLQAGIKPTALCSAIDKENSIESPLDFLHYLLWISSGTTVIISLGLIMNS